MIALEKKKPSTSEQGFALIIALLTLLLISAALMGMFIMSNTETNVSANFRDEQTAYFASKAGVEEVRDRMRSSTTNSLSGNIPTTALPGAANGILYVTNPAAGDTVTPWLTTGTNFPDDEISKELNCTGGAPTGTWYVTPAASASTSYAATPILTWKWVRVMAKANKSDTGCTRVTSVDGTINGNRVCWNGTNEFTTAAASCSAVNPTANFQPVYEVTALAVTTSGSRRMRQYEVSRTTLPGVPGAFVFDGSNPSFNPPASHPFIVSGTDPTHPGGTLNGVTCPTPANQPALGAYDNGSVTTLANDLIGPPDRSSSYTSNTPYSTTPPAISNVSSSLSSGTMNLTTVDGLTKLVNMLTNAAGANVFPNANSSTPTNLGTNSAPMINVVQGNYSYTGSGTGILLVTGQLTLNGNFSFNGLILAIGEGAIVKSGGGSGTVNGAMFAANLYHDTPPPGPYTNPIALGHNYAPGIPYFGWSGGGSATIQYDSCWINDVTQGLPFLLVAQRELIY